MRKILVLSLALVLGISLATPLAAGDAVSKELPFYGAFTGWVFPFDTNPEAIAERCTDNPEGKGAWAIASFEGWGNVTHMGRTYVYAEHCSYASIELGPDGTYGQGELFLYAANGDMLYATYDDGTSLPPPDIQFTDLFTFHDGGTGRFSFASGHGIEMGTVDLGSLPPSFTLEMAGVISYKRR